MFNDAISKLPPGFTEIQKASQTMGFSMPSDLQTGALLRALVGTKRNARVLEIGTGTGLATAWLLAGMDTNSSLISIDNESAYQETAEQVLGSDPRLQLICTDAGNWLENNQMSFDLIFADAWPGKYANLNAALKALAPGGMYIIDDMLPQPNWPDDHGNNVSGLVDDLESRDDLNIVKMAWSTGILIVSRR